MHFGSGPDNCNDAIDKEKSPNKGTLSIQTNKPRNSVCVQTPTSAMKDIFSKAAWTLRRNKSILCWLCFMPNEQRNSNSLFSKKNTTSSSHLISTACYFAKLGYMIYFIANEDNGADDSALGQAHLKQCASTYIFVQLLTLADSIRFWGIWPQYIYVPWKVLWVRPRCLSPFSVILHV